VLVVVLVVVEIPKESRTRTIDEPRS